MKQHLRTLITSLDIEALINTKVKQEQVQAGGRPLPKVDNWEFDEPSHVNMEKRRLDSLARILTGNEDVCTAIWFDGENLCIANNAAGSREVLDSMQAYFSGQVQIETVELCIASASIKNYNNKIRANQKLARHYNFKQYLEEEEPEYLASMKYAVNILRSNQKITEEERQFLKQVSRPLRDLHKVIEYLDTSGGSAIKAVFTNESPKIKVYESNAGWPVLHAEMKLGVFPTKCVNLISGT